MLSHYGVRSIPASITTPDKVRTRIGTLEFFDGFPTDATAQKCLEHLDFLRGVEAFMCGLPGASLVAMRAGMREIGAVNGTISITETLMDSKSLFLTPNTESIYTGTWLDRKDGPIVVESPPNTLGIVNEEQLDSDDPRKRLKRYSALLRPAGTVVRPELAAGRDRAYGINRVYKIL